MTLLVLGGVSLGILAHLLDLLLGEAAGGGNRDLLLLLGTEILGRDVENAVGVDIERNLDLRNAARRRRNAVEIKVTERLVVAGHLAVALEDRDRNGGLIVGGRREDLGLLRGNRRIALDKRGENAAQSLDAERKRSYVEKENVLDFALQDAALDRRAHGNDFVGVNALVRLLVEEALGLLLNKRHARLAADENDLVDARKIGVAHALAARLARAVDEIHRKRLKLGLVESHRQVLGPRRIGRDERQVDVVGRRARKSALRFLGLFFETLESHHVLRKINALFGPEIFDHPLHDSLVEVIAAEVGVAVGGLDLENAVADIEYGDIERTAAEVVNRDLLIFLLVETVRERRGRGLVDDTPDLETRDLAGVLGRLTLLVVEVGGNGNNGLGDLLAKERLGVLFELAKNHSRNLLRGVNLLAYLDGGIAVSRANDLVRHHLDLVGHFVEPAADETLDRVNRRLRVGDSLTLGGLTYEHFARLGERDDRRCSALTFLIGNNRSLAAFHNGHTAVGGTQVNS